MDSWQSSHDHADGCWGEDWLERARECITPGISASSVLGTMPNMPANRSNHQLDLRGPSFTVSAEEFSGLYALESACAALSRGDIDLALVAAVDMAAEAVHQEAVRVHGQRNNKGSTYSSSMTQTDAAVVLLVQRKSDALRAGREVYAQISSEFVAGRTDAINQATLTRILGSPHAASGLLSVAVAALLLKSGLTVRDERVQLAALGGARHLDVEANAIDSALSPAASDLECSANILTKSISLKADSVPSGLRPSQVLFYSKRTRCQS